VGQHVEFEAEWETGINIQLKLAPVVALALEWCSRDREVAIKALRKALRALEGAQGRMTAIGRELADHSASCVDYDVSQSPVSIHLPLSRFVAGLLLCLDRFGLGYDSHEFQFRGKPTPEQLMELPLRTQVRVTPCEGRERPVNGEKQSWTSVNAAMVFTAIVVQGRYELRPEFYNEFNPFFYHYTREEQSKAEEAQLRRRKQAGLEPCCPPPVPPEFARPFAMVVNLLQCDVMLRADGDEGSAGDVQVLNLVLERSTSPSTSAFSETQLEKALHLIGIALHEEQRLRDKGVPMADSFFAFTTRASQAGLAAALEK
ncbi:hypothetical protein V5799_004695, partial [Amblyomma americanum]